MVILAYLSKLIVPLVQFSSVKSLERLGHQGTYGMIQLGFSSSLFGRRPL